MARINNIGIAGIIEEVQKYFKLESKETITVRKGADKNARKLAMFLAVKHCKKLNSLKEIASHFNVSYYAISSNTKKCKDYLAVNKKFKLQVKEIDGKIIKKA